MNLILAQLLPLLAGQQTAVGASDNFLEWHRTGDKAQDYFNKICLTSSFTDILWTTKEFNLRLKHLHLSLYTQEYMSVFGLWISLLTSSNSASTVHGFWSRTWLTQKGTPLFEIIISNLRLGPYWGCAIAACTQPRTSKSTVGITGQTPELISYCLGSLLIYLCLSSLSVLTRLLFWKEIKCLNVDADIYLSKPKLKLFFRWECFHTIFNREKLLAKSRQGSHKRF